MTYFCSQKNRRALVLDHPTLNGIDYLEVCSTEPGCDCGKLLNLTFLKDVRPLSLGTTQIKLTGGALEPYPGKYRKPAAYISRQPKTPYHRAKSTGRLLDLYLGSHRRRSNRGSTSWHRPTTRHDRLLLQSELSDSQRLPPNYLLPSRATC